MELLLDEHQRLLQESASRLCRDFARGAQDAAGQIDKPAWEAMAKAGWSGLLVPEAAGGMGLGAIELFLLQTEIGRHDVRVPLAATAIAARELALSSGAAARELLPAALEGTLTISLCLQGKGTAFAPQGELPRAERHGNQLSLHGQHLAIPGVTTETTLLVAAHAQDRSLLLSLIAPGDPGLAIKTRQTIDGASIDDLTFEDVVLPADAVVAERGAAETAMTRMQAMLAVAVSAELLGLGEAVMEMLLLQFKSREQFGRPIGAFQALQHRAVDGFITLELLRSLVFRVASAIDRDRCHPAMLPALRAKAGRGVLALTRLAVQMHGAMGYTAEHEIGRRYKRALALSALYGNEAHQYEQFAILTGESA